MRKERCKHFRLAAAVLAAISLAQIPAANAIPSFAAEKDYTLSNCYWDTDDGKMVAKWDKSTSTQTYTVTLYLDGEKVSNSIEGSSSGKISASSYDFSKIIPEVNKPGAYSFSVKATKGDHDVIDSETIEIDEDEIASLKEFGRLSQSFITDVDANGNRIGPGGSKGVDYAALLGSQYAISSDGTANSVLAQQLADEQKKKEKEEAAALKQKRKGSWKHDANGWWYENADGSTTKDDWLTIEDDGTFLFDKDGYLVTGWVERDGKWYYLAQDDDPNGFLLGSKYVGMRTPDGYQVDADGAMIN